MLYVLAGSIAFLDILLYKYSNVRKFLLIINFIFLWIMLGWARGAYDIEIGISRYMYADKYSSFTEPLFSYLVLIGNKFKMNYRCFYAIIAFLELFFIFKFINKHTKYGVLTLGLFIIFPMAYVFTLTRHFLAYCVVLCGAIDTLLDKGKLYEVKFVFFIIIASLIHYSSIFFLLYLVVDKLDLKKTIIVTIALTMILSSASAFSGIVSIFSNYVNAEKINNILNNSIGDGILGRTITSLVLFFTFIIIYYLNKNLLNEDKFWNKYKNYLVLKINIVNLVSIPLTIFYGIGFSRIMVLSLIINYVAYSNMIRNVNIRHINKKTLYTIILIIFCISFELYATYRGEPMQELSLRPMFEQNEFLKSDK